MRLPNRPRPCPCIALALLVGAVLLPAPMLWAAGNWDAVGSRAADKSAPSDTDTAPEPEPPPPAAPPAEPVEDGPGDTSLPQYRLAVRVDIDVPANHGVARGTMTIKGWGAGQTTRRCVYLPYNDDDYEFDPIRAFDLVPRKYAKPERHHGGQTATVKTPGLTSRALSPHVLEIDGPIGEGGVALEFESTLPRWPDAADDEWVFSDFHPQPLSECPLRPDDSRTFAFVPSARIAATLTRAGDWQVASPGLPIGAQASHPADGEETGTFDLRFEGRKLVVALLKNFQHWALPIPGTAAEVYFHDPGFEKLIPAIQSAISVDTDLFGPPPFPHLVILETADVEKSSLPGMIAINRPRQVGMSRIQGDVLNWTDWQITGFIAEEWFGASITTRTLDDLWLLRGFVDFATIEALSAVPKRFSLFRPEAGEDPAKQMNFDYRQNEDLLAAALTYFHPYNALTDAQFNTLEPFDKQHSLSYIRHALALRQINWTLGRPAFRSILRRFATQFRGKAIAPGDFGRFYEQAIKEANLKVGDRALTYLKQWWTSDEWPDFELLGVDEEDAPGGGHDVAVRVGQSNGFILPVTVTVTDKDGKTYVAPATQDKDDKDVWVAKVRTTAASDRVDIDKGRLIFDWDRFNNTDAWPDVNFLPGGAKTFADDAYTVLWLPLPSQLPGQPLTMQLVGQSFRYMHNSITGIASYVPSTHALGYSVYYLTDYPKLGSYMVLDALQDRPLSYSHERLLEAAMYKTLNFVKDPYMELGVRARNREVVDRPETRHQTLALKGLVQPLNQYGGCNYSGKFEFEHSVHSLTDAYKYDRDFGIADGSCKVAEYLELGGRVFAGELARVGFDEYEGGNIRFHPQDINEARLRFDQPGLNRVDRIVTAGADILIPAPLPIPDDLYVLKRETRYRIFYDFGESDLPYEIYKDAGIGLWIPVGADLVGKGSVSALNFSLLLVLYREAGDFHSRAPGVLFDFDFLGKI